MNSRERESGYFPEPGGESDEPEKPPYESPLTYSVQNGQELWRVIQHNVHSIDAGPALSQIAAGFSPKMIFDDSIGNLAFWLYVNPIFEGKYLSNMSDQDLVNFGTLLHTHVDKRLVVQGLAIHREWESHREGQRNLELVARTNTSEVGDTNVFSYSPQKTRITSEEQFLYELDQGLQIMRIYISELYRSNGLKVPEEYDGPRNLCSTLRLN